MPTSAPSAPDFPAAALPTREVRSFKHFLGKVADANLSGLSDHKFMAHLARHPIPAHVAWMGHAFAQLFDACPSLLALLPSWSTRLGDAGALVHEFGLELTTMETEGVDLSGFQGFPAKAFYDHIGNWPASFASAPSSLAFSRAIQAGQQAHPHRWATTQPTLDGRYASAAEVEQALAQAVVPLLASLRHLALEGHLRPARSTSRPGRL